MNARKVTKRGESSALPRSLINDINGVKILERFQVSESIADSAIMQKLNEATLGLKVLAISILVRATWREQESEESEQIRQSRYRNRESLNRLGPRIVVQLCHLLREIALDSSLLPGTAA